ncbi:MAG: hypothetical protein JKY94_17575 [Rhodobacteraceae bacterium]|nr:hypothetical protein [Paracoccaceae bacterium]
MLQLNNTTSNRTVVTAGEALGQGQLVGIAADGLAYLADSDHATASLRNAIGVALSSVAVSEVVTLAVRGPLAAPAHGLPVGGVLFLSETPGGFTPSAPTTPRLIGLAISADTLWLDCPGSWAAS